MSRFALLFLLTFSGCFVGHFSTEAQVTADTLSVDSTFWRTNIYQGDSLIPMDDAIAMLETNRLAKQEMRKGLRSYQLSLVLAGVGGILIGIPIGISFAGEEHIYILAGAGFALVAGSAYLFTNYRKKTIKAVRLFNNAK